MTPITAVMLAYKNERSLLWRLRGLVTALRHVGLEAEVLVIDNSPARSWRVAAMVDASGFPSRYCWQGGRNLMYGPSMNLAARLAVHPVLLYVCGNHGKSIDPSWPLDLLAPLADERVAMTGSLQDAGPPEQLGFSPDLPHLHVQGGVMAVRVDVLRVHPYPEGDLAHWGSDVYQSLQLMAAGWQLADVPTIRSVWREDIGDGPWKYVHRGG